MPSLLSLLCVSLSFGCIVFSCQKDPETIIKTVTVRDTLTITRIDTVILKEYFKDSATTFILSRHAETTGIGSDPSLSALGQERANELVRILKNTPIHGVYSTNYNRTKETASKIALNYGLNIQLYDASKLNELAEKILKEYSGRVVYIAGHSNTTNVLLNSLVGSTVYGTIPDAEYDNLYIVNVNTIGQASVVHLKYGK